MIPSPEQIKKRLSSSPSTGATIEENFNPEEDLESSDEITTELMDMIIKELGDASKVSVLVNGLGSTPLMELYIIYKKVNEILKTNKIEIHSSFVGEYVTSLEMNGASITLLNLDEELQPLLENPAQCSMFSV